MMNKDKAVFVVDRKVKVIQTVKVLPQEFPELLLGTRVTWSNLAWSNSRKKGRLNKNEVSE